MLASDKRMSSEEVLSEVHWLLDYHCDPQLIAQILHRKLGSIYQLARRAKDERVMQAFSAIAARTYQQDRKTKSRRIAA